MSVQVIIQSLAKLISVHKNLIEISEQKTASIKEGSVEKLQQLLIKEHKQVQRLGQVETERQKLVETWFQEQQIELENVTITHILEIISNEKEHTSLEQMTIDLTKLITRLKQQEQLNQALLEQSMQFVQVSLDMMSPTITNMNYGNKQGTESEQRSVFDSKA